MNREYCPCPRPQAFTGSETCNACGRAVRGAVKVGSLELALAEIALEQRRLTAHGGKLPASSN